MVEYNAIIDDKESEIMVKLGHGDVLLGGCRELNSESSMLCISSIEKDKYELGDDVSNKDFETAKLNVVLHFNKESDIDNMVSILHAMKQKFYE